MCALGSRFTVGCKALRVRKSRGDGAARAGIHVGEGSLARLERYLVRIGSRGVAVSFSSLRLSMLQADNAGHVELGRCQGGELLVYSQGSAVTAMMSQTKVQYHDSDTTGVYLAMFQHGSFRLEIRRNMVRTKVRQEKYAAGERLHHTRSKSIGRIKMS